MWFWSRLQNGQSSTSAERRCARGVRRESLAARPAQAAEDRQPPGPPRHASREGRT
jgi:hypothetical protein